ncbi:MAG: hypothetical protein JXC32_08665 [Anaerolineae bacterium]|nr:hypothetical protein [Anaerolineae bacterium]
MTSSDSSYITTRRITTLQGTLFSRELVDQSKYLGGQTVESPLKTRDDFEV